MRETDSVQILRKSLQHCFPGGLYYKPRDIGRDQKPFDIFFFWKGRFVAIEAKIVKNDKRFYFSAIEKHQIEALETVFKNYGHAYVAIHMYRPNNKTTGRYSAISFININELKAWMNKRKSATWNELSNSGYVSFCLPVFKGAIDLNEAYFIEEILI